LYDDIENEKMEGKYDDVKKNKKGVKMRDEMYDSEERRKWNEEKLKGKMNLKGIFKRKIKCMRCK
jgi:hypothetical protein